MLVISFNEICLKHLLYSNKFYCEPLFNNIGWSLPQICILF